jgi:5-methyltetrahydropteroyltriglutamate--homocysteine methyltransferase
VSRAVLQGLGIDLPLLPATSVGSLPKPDVLVAARAKRARNEITAEELRSLEMQATECWIARQEELGLDVLVDGEMYRGDLVGHFASLLGGFVPAGLVRTYGNRYYRKPVLVSEVKWPGPLTVEWWRAAQAMSGRPVKSILTGPYTLLDWSFNEFYPSRGAAVMALARELRKEVETLVEAGAKIIQIDEPALSSRPAELTLAVEALHVVTHSMPAYFIVHACYGALESIYPGLLAAPVHNWDLELSSGRLDLGELCAQHPFSRDLSVGVADVHAGALEDTETVQKRVEGALAALPVEQLWIDPDCGLKTRTAEDAIAVLRLVVEAAHAARGAVGETR